MLFTSKSNTNATTNATENTANQETGNNNGGLLKGIAIGVGTLAGIGLAAFGGTKAYKHFHVKDENRLDDVTDNETPAENAEDTTNETTVENFNEVETEATENEAPAKAEKSVDETTTEAEEAKVEEPIKKAPVEGTTTKTEETNKPEPKETVTMKFERMLDEAVSRIPYDKPESVDLAFYIRCVGGYLHEIDMDEAGNTGRFVIAEHCIAMTDLVSKAIMHMASANINDLKDYHGVYGDIKRLTKEFKASKIMDFTQKPELCKEKFEESLTMVEKNLTLTKQILKLKEAKPASKSAGETQTADVEHETKSSTKKVTGETKTVTKASGKKQTEAKASKTVDVLAADPIDVINQFAEPVVDEKQATTKESPSETQIGNSTVISDDGETVTLKASVSEDSVQNVMDVIDIVSKIPNREDPEKNDMPYYIRVIGDRIAGITEPEATFLAYNDKTKSNDFIDACVSLCNMVGNGICNLADQKSNPIESLGWINRSYDELIASGVIDNTYNPQAMRDALTKARNEATRVLADMVNKSDETQADDNKVTGETKTVTNGKLIDEINTYVHAINVMACKNFTMVSTNSFVEKLHKIDECISLLDNSEPSKAIKRNAYKNINITVRLFCTSKLEDIDACANRNDIVDLCADVRAMLSLNLTNVELSETTLNAINNAITSAKDKKDKADVIVAKHENQGLAKASDETQADDKSSAETQTEETLTYTMSEKIQEAVQQSDETAATAAPEPESQAPMSPEASSLAAKLQEVGNLMRAEKWSDASEFYKTQLTPYLADDGLSKELRDEIMGIKTKATNMLMSQKQLEAKQKAASAKASKKSSKKNKQRRRH